ncbi:hypothetical protein Tco_0799574 [Tanacetum coccineum]|uniref:Uncharacterized protein n=1 Tax=Tanacetum coccineum TaxID=301880 RepID=A0ABQ4ZSZ8_9ASTR
MLAPSSEGLIIYQAYGNLYAMPRKAHLLEDKQIPSVGVFDEVSLYTLFRYGTLPHRNMIHPWLRCQVEGYDEGDRLTMVYTRHDRQAFFTSHAWRRLFELGRARCRMTWRQFILALGLHTKEEMAEAGFVAYWSGGRHLRRHAEGRKSRARLSGGHFIGRLVAHFRLVSDQGLRGLSVVASELPLIDLHELGRLNICLRFGDTWAWVASGPERQQAGALGATEDAPTADEGAQAVPAPVQAPQPPPLAPQHRTMLQRIERIKEEMCELRQSVVGLQGVVKSSITEHTRVSTWMISSMTRLMDASGHTYQAFYSTLVGSSRVSYQRRVRPRTGDASTSTAPHTDDQHDP